MLLPSGQHFRTVAQTSVCLWNLCVCPKDIHEDLIYPTCLMFWYHLALVLIAREHRPGDHPMTLLALCTVTNATRFVSDLGSQVFCQYSSNHGCCQWQNLHSQSPFPDGTYSISETFRTFLQLGERRFPACCKHWHWKNLFKLEVLNSCFSLEVLGSHLSGILSTY